MKCNECNENTVIESINTLKSDTKDLILCHDCYNEYKDGE